MGDGVTRCDRNAMQYANKAAISKCRGFFMKRCFLPLGDRIELGTGGTLPRRTVVIGRAEMLKRQCSELLKRADRRLS